VGPPRGAVRHPGRQRGGRAVQRKPRPASPPPAPGRSSGGPTAPTATPATVKAVASAGRPTVPPAATAPADPTNPRSEGWLPMPADPTPPRRVLDADGQLVTHPERKIARVATGSTPPRRAELGRATRFSSLVAAPGHGGLIRVLHASQFPQDRTCDLGERCTAGDRCEPLDSDGVWTKRGPRHGLLDGLTETARLDAVGVALDRRLSQRGSASDRPSSRGPLPCRLPVLP
jgi:hypothetical protein